MYVLMFGQNEYLHTCFHNFPYDSSESRLNYRTIHLTKGTSLFQIGSLNR